MINRTAIAAAAGQRRSAGSPSESLAIATTPESHHASHQRQRPSKTLHFELNLYIWLANHHKLASLEADVAAQDYAAEVEFFHACGLAAAIERQIAVAHRR